jgi:hypothetical protein
MCPRLARLPTQVGFPPLFDASVTRLTLCFSASIPIAPPHGTPPPPLGQLLPDVQMAESSSTEVGSQPDDAHDDISMKTETANSTPPPSALNGHGYIPTFATDASMASVTSHGDDGQPSPTGLRRSADAMLEDEPPAKRARKMSDDEHELELPVADVSPLRCAPDTGVLIVARSLSRRPSPLLLRHPLPPPPPALSLPLPLPLHLSATRRP